MGFFPPLPPHEPEPEPALPPRFGPPRNELGVTVPERFVLVRAEGVAIAVTGIAAYSTGFAFELELRMKLESETGASELYRLMAALGHGGPAAQGDVLRVGLEYADGRRGTGGATSDADEISVTGRGAGGGGGNSHVPYSISLWAHPLPPPGPVTFVIEWTGEGIGLTRGELGEELHEAGLQSEALWPEPFPPKDEA